MILNIPSSVSFGSQNQSVIDNIANAVSMEQINIDNPLNYTNTIINQDAIDNYVLANPQTTKGLGVPVAVVQNGGNMGFIVLLVLGVWAILKGKL